MSVSLSELMQTATIRPALESEESEGVASKLHSLVGERVYSRSIVFADHACYFLTQSGREKHIGAIAPSAQKLEGLQGNARTVEVDGETFTVLLGPTSDENARQMRERLPYLSPKPLGLKRSIGCGDRLGLATPGHIRAVRAFRDQGGMMEIITAQQSIRENARTHRTPQQVMDDAMWGVFEEGWREGFGADADHLKTEEDVDACAAAGFTFYTIDPGDLVDDDADHATGSTLQAKVDALPWDVLDSSPQDLVSRLAKEKIDLGDEVATVDEEAALRAAAKYGRAVAHAVVMHRRLVQVMGDRPFELEVSVDETNTVTRLEEHIYIAHELRRLGVPVISLAPRYVGAFEKGVDYIGDLEAFRRDFARHFAVSEALGPYKLSLHSGSDKFSIYGIAAEIAGERVHVKTAGTSYLEALRAVAHVNPDLFRQIAAFAAERYPTDRQTYIVSAEVERAPDLAGLSDEELHQVLDQFDMRQILHTTFGSVLNHPDFRAPMLHALQDDEETYYRVLEEHFAKHLQPFA